MMPLPVEEASDVLARREASATPGRAPFYLDAGLIAEESGEASPRCAVIRDMAALEALRGEWLALERSHARDVHAFQTYAWCHAWASVYASGGRGASQLFIITVRRHGRLVLVWPMMLCKLGPLRSLSWLSDPFSQYGDILTSLSGDDLHAAMELACETIRAQRSVDIVRLRHVRADANVTPFLESRFLRAAWQDGAPWMDLEAFANEQEYERRYSKSQRRRRRRIARALEEELGDKLEFSLIDDGDDLRGSLSALIGEKRAWLARKGLVSRPLASPGLEEFLSRLAAEGGGGHGPRLVISRMQAAGRPVSWELGFRFRGRHYGYVTAHDRELTDFSPGRLHMDMSQKRALKDGMRVFDLLVPAAPHKKTWSSAVEPVRDYYRPMTPAGKLIGETYLRHLRPLLRRLYQKAPEKLRRKLGLGSVAG